MKKTSLLATLGGNLPQFFCNFLARYDAMSPRDAHAQSVEDFPNLLHAASSGSPQNANTTAAAITTAFLVTSAVTKLQDKLAPISAFAREFSADTYKPKAHGVLKYVPTATASTNTGKNLTNFEDGDTTTQAVEVTVDQYSRPFNISNSDLQSGLRMDDLLEINTTVFAKIVSNVIKSNLTRANFPQTPLISLPASFNYSEIRTIAGVLKKSPVKNLIIDGEYVASLLNAPTNFQTTVTGVTGNNPAALKPFGIDGLYTDTDWTAADTGVRGVALNPQALGVVAGLPVFAPAATMTLTRVDFAVPGIDMHVALHTWFSLASRTGWACFDIMLGAQPIDTSAALLITES